MSLQDAAVESLKSLNKSDVVEVRALQQPPVGVKLVIEAVCIMKEVKPKKVVAIPTCTCSYIAHNVYVHVYVYMCYYWLAKIVSICMYW